MGMHGHEGVGVENIMIPRAELRKPDAKRRLERPDSRGCSHR